MMLRSIAALAAVALASSAPDASVPEPLEGELRYSGSASGPVVVQAYLLAQGEDGRVRRLSKDDVLGGARPARTQALDRPGRYRFEGLEGGRYSVVAFMDLDGDGVLDFAPPEPFGWYAAEAG
ncbi:MAG: hypothetical protein FIA95_00105, partial [Gemmatimonadetes bacterium]|nr:hypothetical protein [Gemmatimonadota bacterium]